MTVRKTREPLIPTLSRREKEAGRGAPVMLNEAKHLLAAEASPLGRRNRGLQRIWSEGVDKD
jgi:hypothetical protein